MNVNSREDSGDELIFLPPVLSVSNSPGLITILAYKPAKWGSELQLEVRIGRRGTELAHIGPVFRTGSLVGQTGSCYVLPYAYDAHT